MKQLNIREQALTESLSTRLNDIDAIGVNAMLDEIESSEPYQNPSHENHKAYLHMRSQVIGRQLELQGVNPNESGNDANSSMMDNQRYYSDNITNDELDFSVEDENFSVSRQNTSNYLQQLQAGKVAGISGEELPMHIQATQQVLMQMDTEQDTIVKDREADLERIEKLELSWEAEADSKRAKIRRDFFERQLRGVLPINKAEAEKLAELQWARLQADFGS